MMLPLNKNISNFDNLPLISPCDIVSINKLTLILKIIGEVEHIMMLQIKTIASVLKVLNTFTLLILAIMHISTFIVVVILHSLHSHN